MGGAQSGGARPVRGQKNGCKYKGLWGIRICGALVLSKKRCMKLQFAQERGASRQAATRVAASVLTRAAVEQGSSDNVTVVVVDLSQYANEMFSHFTPISTCPKFR